MPLVNRAQSKAISGNDTTEMNIEEKFKAFSTASDFFFSALRDNFEGDDDGENMYALMKIFATPREEPEDFYKYRLIGKNLKC